MADEVEERKSSKSGNRSGPYQRRSRVGSHFYFRQVETGPRSLMLRNRAVSTLGTPALHSPLSSASNCSSTSPIIPYNFCSSHVKDILHHWRPSERSVYFKKIIDNFKKYKTFEWPRSNVKP